MPAVSAIVINDGKATPVAHTFEPARTSADMATYEDRVATQYIGYNKLMLMLKRPTGPSKVANRNLQAVIRIETPVLETLGTSDSGITPAPTLSYRPMVEVVFTLPERSLEQERKDLRFYLYNALGNPQVIGLIEKFSVPY